ncbi:MAG: dockerin type I domain-containing protein [Planctomycetota bacterium]
MQFSMRALRRFVAAIVLTHVCFESVSIAQNLLVMDINPILSNGLAAAASIAGATVVDASSSTAFVDELENFGPWDVVIIDCPSSGMDTTVAQAIATYIANDGRAIIGYWDLDGGGPGAILRPAFGIDVTLDYLSPLPVFAWDPGHPIWTTPNPVSSPLPTIATSWNDDGDRLAGVPGTTAVGGFVDSVGAVNESAIVLGNDNRTICNGFVFDNFAAATIVPLLVNEITFLLSGGGPPGDEYRRGDVNDDAVVNIADVVNLLNALFVPGSPPPTCTKTGDTNDDAVVNVADAVFFLNSLFVPGSPPIAPPGPGCGVDPTPDALDCVLYTTCP